jgi:hypothetical protein
MININKQLDSIINEQVSKMMPMLDKIPDGEQKDYIVNAMNQLKEKRTLDASEFVEGFAKLKGEEIDIEKLRETVKKNK